MKHFTAVGDRKQSGFTLMELIVALALLGILAWIVAMTFGIATQSSTMLIGQNLALNEVHVVGQWVARDVVSAVANTVQSTSGNTLCTMQSYFWNSSTNTFDQRPLTYTFDNGKLIRQVGSYSGVPIAQYIDSNNTTFICVDNVTKYFSLTVNSQYEGNSVTRTFKIKQVLSQ